MVQKNVIAAKFQFVGSSTRAQVEKIDWPLEAQAIIIKTHKIDGIGGQKAFEVGVALYNDGVEKGLFTGSAIPLPLPKSYCNKNAGSVLYGMEQRFLARCEKDNKDTLALAEKYGIIEPKA
jgi:hypothetical protein